MIKKSKTVLIPSSLSAVLALSILAISPVNAAQNPVQMNNLSQGILVADSKEYIKKESDDTQITEESEVMVPR